MVIFITAPRNSCQTCHPMSSQVTTQQPYLHQLIIKHSALYRFNFYLSVAFGSRVRRVAGSKTPHAAPQVPSRLPPQQPKVLSKVLQHAPAPDSTQDGKRGLYIFYCIKLRVCAYCKMYEIRGTTAMARISRDEGRYWHRFTYRKEGRGRHRGRETGKEKDTEAGRHRQTSSQKQMDTQRRATRFEFKQSYTADRQAHRYRGRQICRPERQREGMERRGGNGAGVQSTKQKQLQGIWQMGKYRDIGR